ncbi:hypothetical protein GCM10029964_076470 [Kibdelosporangium lantanae]
MPAMTWVDAGRASRAQPVLDDQLNRALSWLGDPAEGDQAPSSVLATIQALGHLNHPLPPVTYTSWAFALPSLGAVAFRAASALTPPDQRQALTAFLRTIAAQKLTNDGHWRTLAAVPTRTDVVKQNALLPVRTGALFLTHESRTWNSELNGFPWFAVQRSNTPGTFALPEGWRLAWEAPWRSGFTSDRITSFCDTLDTRGPVNWRPELAGELVARTGMSTGEALLILAGLPHVQSWQTSYLDKHTRDRIGLTAASAKASRERLNTLGHWVNRALLHSAIPTDPVDLWATGPNLDGIAADWNNRIGRRTPVPEELLLEAEKLLPITNTAEFVSGVTNPDTCAWLTTDFRAVHLEAVSNVLPWLAYRLPTTSPLRPRLARALAAARLRGISHIDNHRDNMIEPLTVLRSEALAAACAATSDGPHAYYQDPTVSVPDVVDEVADRHGLDRDSAALYLQLLALPDPTDKNVARWTGWKEARLRKARTTLVETNLVVTAKRSRAGRSVFLPGPWIALTSPHLPLEAWKARYFRFDDQGRAVAVLVPVGPVADLFHRAWQRVKDGDAPSL